jgi:hypothetical protein
MGFSTVFITHQRQTLVSSFLDTENLDRRLVDHIDSVDAKEVEISFFTAQNRITILQSCSQHVSHHTEWDLDVSAVGNLLLNIYFQCKKEMFGVQEKVVLWMYTYVLQTVTAQTVWSTVLMFMCFKSFWIILYKDSRLVLVQVGANSLQLGTSTLVRTP